MRFVLFFAHPASSFIGHVHLRWDFHRSSLKSNDPPSFQSVHLHSKLDQRDVGRISFHYDEYGLRFLSILIRPIHFSPSFPIGHFLLFFHLAIFTKRPSTVRLAQSFTPSSFH
jgi:hypothetical protein